MMAINRYGWPLLIPRHVYSFLPDDVNVDNGPRILFIMNPIHIHQHALVILTKMAMILSMSKTIDQQL